MTIKGLKTMILGLAIMLFGGIFTVDPRSNGPFALIVLIGLLIVLYGYFHDE